jgi:UDP-glucose 4-epimerase
MKILITGAGGNLGRAAVPLLRQQGHALRLMDFRPLDVPTANDIEAVAGDVRDSAAVRRAMAGMDAVVHAAALHGIHMGHWSPQDFWDINVSGTFHVFEAARLEGVNRVVLCSTMGVYGQSAHPLPDAWNVVTEDLPCLSSDVYGMSKVLCEEMGRHYGRSAGITTLALRLGMFVPEPTLERYGFRLLFGGVDDRDVAQAIALCLSSETQERFDAFNVMAEVPFTPEDAAALQKDPVAVLEQYYPGCTDLFRSRGINAPEMIWGRTIWSVEKAKQKIGYDPQYSFSGFCHALTAGGKDYYPPQGLPWWGV